MHLLGHGTREDFARERLGCSWSHVRELHLLREGLDDLPRLREAFLLGALRRARLREILRVATPETESAWLLLARFVTSAELAARVRAARGKDAPPDEPGPDLQRVSIRVSPEEAVFIESIGLPMLRAVVGKEGPKHELMSALAAEILAERGHEPIEADPPRPGSCKSGRSRRLRRTLRSQAKAAARARRMLQRLTARSGGEPEIAWPVMAGTCVESRLAHAQVLFRWRRALEAQRAVLLDHFHERAWHRLRGHATFGDWLDRRLGLAPREVRLLERVVHDVAALPELEAAWRSGEMSALQADKIARVATPETASDWLRFVGEATSKRLDVELAAHAALRVHLGDEGWHAATDGGRPLRERSMGDLRLRWADVALSPGLRGAPVGQMQGGRGEATEAYVLVGRREPSPKSNAADGPPPPPQLPQPQEPRGHHVLYRSRGGGNERWNLVTACRPCHALEHLGHIFVKCVDVAQSRGGIAPLLEVRVGDEALRSSTHVYREGLRRRRLEHWQRGPSLVGMVVSW